MNRLAWIMYGGSFDPPHKGHNLVLDEALRSFPGAKGLVIPAYAAPVAGEGIKQAAASYEDRLVMSKIAFAKSPFVDRIEVLDIESQLPQPNYSINTLRALVEQYGDGGALLIGDDQLEVFHLWKAAKEILSMVSLVVVARHKDPEEFLLKVSDELGLDIRKSEGGHHYGCPNLGTKFYFLPKLSSASSTEIRQNPKEEENLDQDVKAYFDSKDLYK